MARIEQPTSRNGRHTDMSDDGIDSDDAATDAAIGADGTMTDAGSEPDFMVELAMAMRGVAARERERLTSRAADDAAGHIAEARAHGATEAEAIRRVADEDIASIETWAEAEVTRIRDDAATRVAERRTDLESALVRHESVIQSEVESVEGALAEYDASLNAFMDDLDEIRDPSEIARLAALLPGRPDLGRVREDARTTALDQIAGAALAADGAIGEVTEADAEMASGIETVDADETPELEVEATSIGEEPPLSEAITATEPEATTEIDAEMASPEGAVEESVEEAGGIVDEPVAAEMADTIEAPADVVEAVAAPTGSADDELSPAPVGVMDLGSMVDDLQAGGLSDGDGAASWASDDGGAIAELRTWDTGVAVVPERTGWETESSASPAVAEAVGTLDPVETAIDAPAAEATPAAEPPAHPFGHTNAAVRLIRSVAPWTAPTAHKENDEPH